MARRRLTITERAEVRKLCRLGRLGQLSAYQNERCTDLYRISPSDYSEASAMGRSDADAELNPLAKQDPDQNGRD